MTAPWERSLAALGGAAGLLGVAIAAAAAHGWGGTNLETAGRFLLLHAPALLALAALITGGVLSPRLGRASGFVIAAGLVLFCGDLAMRAIWGIRLAPMAAPIGGTALMLGWALACIAAFWPRSVRL